MLDGPTILVFEEKDRSTSSRLRKNSHIPHSLSMVICLFIFCVILKRTFKILLFLIEVNKDATKMIFRVFCSVVKVVESTQTQT